MNQTIEELFYYWMESKCGTYHDNVVIINNDD